MLVNLSNRTNKAVVSKARKNSEWKFLLLFPAWVIVSFFAAQLLLVVILSALKLFGIQLTELINPSVVQTLMMCFIYGVTLAIAVGVPYFIRDRYTSLETLGLQRLMSWTDLGLAPMAFIVYGILVAILSAVVMSLWPDFAIDQEQNVGFRSLGSSYEYAAAFIALVVIAPIAEETLLRGYLYGKLRPHVPLYAVILVTSIIFAAAHGQWNVAMDTFVLGIILAGLREITGSIWAGIVVHMIKNAIAFFATFVPFMLLGT